MALQLKREHKAVSGICSSRVNSKHLYPGNPPIILLFTTSTGEPMQTAKKPAPLPEARWQGRVSSKRPVAMRDSLICRAESAG